MTLLSIIAIFSIDEGREELKKEKKMKTIIKDAIDFEQVFTFVREFKEINSNFHIWCENHELSIDFLDNNIDDKIQKTIYDAIEKEFDIKEYLNAKLEEE